MCVEPTASRRLKDGTIQFKFAGELPRLVSFTRLRSALAKVETSIGDHLDQGADWLAGIANTHGGVGLVCRWSSFGSF